jgi:hypothetical protein
MVATVEQAQLAQATTETEGPVAENTAKPSPAFDIDRLCWVIAGVVQRTLQAKGSTGDKPADPGPGEPTAAGK